MSIARAVDHQTTSTRRVPCGRPARSASSSEWRVVAVSDRSRWCRPSGRNRRAEPASLSPCAGRRRSAWPAWRRPSPAWRSRTPAPCPRSVSGRIGLAQPAAAARPLLRWRPDRRARAGIRWRRPAATAESPPSRCDGADRRRGPASARRRLPDQIAGGFEIRGQIQQHHIRPQLPQAHVQGLLGGLAFQVGQDLEQHGSAAALPLNCRARVAVRRDQQRRQLLAELSMALPSTLPVGSALLLLVRNQRFLPPSWAGFDRRAGSFGWQPPAP